MDREFEQAGYRAERALMASVEPHWPTYHRVMAICNKLADACSSARSGDVGDFLASRGAVEELPAILAECGIEDGSQAADIWESIVRSKRITERQSKALAIACAKAKTMLG